MNYNDCLNFLFQQLPMYHRIGEKAYKPGLTNISSICHYLKHPQHQFKSIHIAGTNGKGSVSHQLAAILQCSGYKVGLYTSPHLVDFRERIRINGKLISEDFVQNFIGTHIHYWKELQPSFFEITTAMAFAFFASENVDIAVIETGLGGRLDATNIITPMISVITNISFDHTELLGNTLDKIAVEKAGIIKTNVPVVIGETNPLTAPVFINKAKECNAEIFFADQLYNCTINNFNSDLMNYTINNVQGKILIEGLCDLTGIYQQKNIVTTFTTIEVLKIQGIQIDKWSSVEGLKNVKDLTGLMGRWQRISKSPDVICDTAHNPAGMEEISTQLSQVNADRIFMILGFVKDKDVQSILTILQNKLRHKEIEYFLTQSSVPRSMDVEQLNELLIRYNLKGNVFINVGEAFQLAKNKANPNDIIFVGGSNFLVGDFIAMLQNKKAV